MSADNKPDLAGLALLTMNGDQTQKPPVMYIWHNGKHWETQDYFAHWGPTPYIRADLSQASVAAALEAAAAHIEERFGTVIAANAIRALIAPAQHDALAAHVAAEVAKARAEIYAQIEAMPRREELLGGQRTQYVQLHEVLAWIGSKP